MRGVGVCKTEIAGTSCRVAADAGTANPMSSPPDSADAVDPVLDQICAALPPCVRFAVRALDPSLRRRIMEIRIRRGRSAIGVVPEGDFHISDITEDDWAAAVRLVTGCSVYALEHELAAGFITIRGGHRVGVVGHTVLEGGAVRSQQELSSLNYRVARQIRGVADRVMPYILPRPGAWPYRTIVVSGPGLGKTTLLRDIARQLSSGLNPVTTLAPTHVGGHDTLSMGRQAVPACEGGRHRAFRVGIVDERSEIAACVEGVPQNDIGPRADVLDGCPKAEGITMMIRSMSPEVIVTDEIGRLGDVEALREAARCGVSVIASAHAGDIADARRRPILREALDEGTFDIAVLLGRSLGLGTCERIVDLNSGLDLTAEPIRLSPYEPCP